MISLDLVKLHRFTQFSFNGEPIEYPSISRGIDLTPTRKYKDITALWRNISRYLTIKGVIKAKVPSRTLKAIVVRRSDNHKKIREALRERSRVILHARSLSNDRNIVATKDKNAAQHLCSVSLRPSWHLNDRFISHYLFTRPPSSMRHYS